MCKLLERGRAAPLQTLLWGEHGIQSQPLRLAASPRSEAALACSQLREVGNAPITASALRRGCDPVAGQRGACSGSSKMLTHCQCAAVKSVSAPPPRRRILVDANQPRAIRRTLKNVSRDTSTSSTWERGRFFRPTTPQNVPTFSQPAGSAYSLPM